MKHILVACFVFVFITACDKDKINNNNPYLNNYRFSTQINLNLPLYQNLLSNGNAVKIYDYGNRGIIIFNTGTGYVAFDGACPNQSLSSCSTLEIVSGINAKCPCDDAVYSLFTGQSPGKQYPLKQYRTELSGSVLIISN